MFRPLFLLIAATAVFASNGRSFSLATSGGILGSIWQQNDGQIRVGGSHSPAKFECSEHGMIASEDFGCILTEVQQLRCKRGAGPVDGFSIGEDCALSFDKNPIFYACPTSPAEWNIYTVPIAQPLECVTINITADHCGAPPSSLNKAHQRQLLGGYLTQVIKTWNPHHISGFSSIGTSRDQAQPPPQRMSQKRGNIRINLAKSILKKVALVQGGPVSGALAKVALKKDGPADAVLKKVGLMKVDPPKLPSDHISSLIIPNMIGGFLGGMMANAVPSLIAHYRHNDKKNDEKVSNDPGEAEAGGDATYNITPAQLSNEEAIVETTAADTISKNTRMHARATHTIVLKKFESAMATSRTSSLSSTFTAAPGLKTASRPMSNSRGT